MPTPAPLSSIDMAVDEAFAQPSSAGFGDLRRNKLFDRGDYLGRHLVLVGLTPVGVFGIAVGATTVILKLADTAIHLTGLMIVWGAAVIVGTLAIIAGLREAAGLAGTNVLPRHSPAKDLDPPVRLPSIAGERSSVPARYQSLRSINPEK